MHQTCQVQAVLDPGHKMKCETKQDIEFDLVGVDASIANALRRIMLAEVREYLLLMSRSEAREVIL